MSTVTRITKNLIGRIVVFHGFDGNDYTAHVEKVSQGVAKIAYRVNVQGSRQLTTAYVSDASRMS